MNSKTVLATLFLTLIGFSSVSYSQFFRVSAGLRSSTITTHSVPVFLTTPQPVGLLSEFRPTIGYEVGLSRQITLGSVILEPALKYCHNAVNQHLYLLSSTHSILNSTTFKLTNNIAELVLPVEKKVRLYHYRLLILAGPYLQFRKYEQVRTDIGQSTALVAPEAQFNYGLVVGIETPIGRRVAIRLQGQTAKYVYGSTGGGYPGYTILLSVHYSFNRPTTDET